MMDSQISNLVLGDISISGLFDFRSSSVSTLVPLKLLVQTQRDQEKCSRTQHLFAMILQMQILCFSNVLVDDVHSKMALSTSKMWMTTLSIGP